MSNKNSKVAKKALAQTAMFVTRAEAAMLWQMINSPVVAVRPAEGHAANGLYNKVKAAAEAVGVSTAPPPPGGNVQA